MEWKKIVSFVESTTKKKINWGNRKMLEYIEHLSHVAWTVLIADLLLRCFRALCEFQLYAKYYEPEQRGRSVLQRCFYYTWPARIFTVVVVGTLLARLSVSKQPLPPLYYYAFMPLYWLIITVQVSHSTVDYAMWLRSDHCLDYAKGMASNYFHGYLNLTMPSYKGHKGLHQRIKVYEDKEGVQFALHRLIILIPKQMYIKPRLESQILEKAKPLETLMCDRAGVNRPFKNDVHRFTIPIGPSRQYYYIIVEGATPLLSFYEAMNSNLTTTWQMREMQREILLEFYRYLKKLCSEAPELQQEVEIVLYDSYDLNNRPVDVGYVIKAHLESLWDAGKLFT